MFGYHLSNAAICKKILLFTIVISFLLFQAEENFKFMYQKANNQKYKLFKK